MADRGGRTGFGRSERGARSISAIIAGLGLLAFVAPPSAALAQAAGGRSDAGTDADDARTDALLGTLNLSTPEPYGNLYSTAPGVEQQVERPQFRFNFLAPLNYDFEPPGAWRGQRQQRGDISSRQPLVGGAGRAIAVPGVGQRPFRVQALLQRARRRRRPPDFLGPAAICRSDQRPGFLALFRHHAEVQLSADFLRSDRGAPGLQPRLQQELASRQRLPSHSGRRRHLGGDGLVVRPDGFRPAPPASAAALLGRFVPHTVRFVGDLQGLERELRSRAARPLVRARTRLAKPATTGKSCRSRRWNTSSPPRCSAATASPTSSGAPRSICRVRTSKCGRLCPTSASTSGRRAPHSRWAGGSELGPSQMHPRGVLVPRRDDRNRSSLIAEARVARPKDGRSAERPMPARPRNWG